MNWFFFQLSFQFYFFENTKIYCWGNGSGFKAVMKKISANKIITLKPNSESLWLPSRNLTTLFEIPPLYKYPKWNMLPKKLQDIELLQTFHGVFRKIHHCLYLLSNIFYFFTSITFPQKSVIVLQLGWLYFACGYYCCFCDIIMYNGHPSCSVNL